jgi:Ca2+-binding RTX toxin-like protein
MANFSIAKGAVRDLPLLAQSVPGFAGTGTHLLRVNGTWSLSDPQISIPLFLVGPFVDSTINTPFVGSIVDRSNWFAVISGSMTSLSAAPALAFMNGGATARNDLRIFDGGSVTGKDLAILATANTRMSNSGTISADQTAILFHGFQQDGDTTPSFNITATSILNVDNNKTGVIQADQDAIVNYSLAALRVTNAGMIKSLAADDDFYAFTDAPDLNEINANAAIYSLGSLTLSNSGTIDGGILMGTFGNHITNTGSLFSTLSVLIERDVNERVDVNRDGDFTDPGDVDITALRGVSVTNRGQWVAMSVNRVNESTGQPYTDEWALLGNDARDSVTNSGTIVGGLDFAGGADLFNNSGIFRGEDITYLVYMGTGNDTVVNSGEIGTVFLNKGMPAKGQFAFTNLFEDILVPQQDVSHEEQWKQLGDIVVMLDDGNDVLSNTGHIFGLVDGGAGNDRLSGGANSDRFYDTEGADWYSMGGGADLIFLSGEDFARDTINGGAGIDALVAQDFFINNGDSLGVAVDLSAGSLRFGTLDDSDTVVFNSTHADRLSGIEQVVGTNGDDILQGSSGADTLIGMNGDDIIEGRGGVDFMNGYLGADTFVFRNITDSGTRAATRDVIWDFELATDTIDLLFDTNSLSAGVQALSLSGFFPETDTFDGTAGSFRALSEGNLTVIELDRNGDGLADFSLGFGFSLFG